MIRSFRHKGLQEVFASGKSRRVAAALTQRICIRLDALNAASSLQDLNIPGFDFHALKGFKPTRYSIHVNGPWTVTFEWNEKLAYAERVDLEQYH